MNIWFNYNAILKPISLIFGLSFCGFTHYCQFWMPMFKDPKYLQDNDLRWCQNILLKELFISIKHKLNMQLYYAYWNSNFFIFVLWPKYACDSKFNFNSESCFVHKTKTNYWIQLKFSHLHYNIYFMILWKFELNWIKSFWFMYNMICETNLTPIQFIH